jgi:hypothetical protein
MNAEPMVRNQDKADRKTAFRPVTLWILVSGLWTCATLLRIYTVWIPFADWRFADESRWIWVSLVIPPAMFGVILAAIHVMKTAPK